MNKAICKINSEKGASLIEMLFALAFLGLTIGAFMNLAVGSMRLALINRTQMSLGQHANLIAEEIVKDYTLGGTTDIETDCTNVPVEVITFLSEFESSGTCSVVKDDSTGTYEVTLTVQVYDRDLESTRSIILK